MITKQVCKIGTAKELISEIPNSSINLVFTDPPYGRDAIELYEFVAKESHRVLKEGSYAFIYASDYYFPETFQLCLKYLDFYYLFHLLLSEGNCARVFPKKLQIGAKTLMVFSKGKGKDHNWVFNTIRSRIERGLHPWQQSVDQARYIIEYFTHEGDTVLDPFAGSGTTLRACRETNRNCIGYEINEVHESVIEKRALINTPSLETWCSGQDVA